MPLLFVPHQYSVIIGKGRDARDAPGTRFLRAEIQSRLQLYKTCTGRLERAQIVSDLLTEQQRRCPLGGVFVKFDGERWWELSEHDARENITAAFRNRLHEKYTSSSKFKSAKRRMQLKTSSLATQSRNSKDHQADDSAVLLVVQEEQGEQATKSRTRTYCEGAPINNEDDPWKERSKSQQGAVFSETCPLWCYPNEINEEEKPQSPGPGSSSRRRKLVDEDNKKSLMDDDRMISCTTNKAATRMAGTAQLVGFLPLIKPAIVPPSNNDVVMDDHDHPQEEGSWTTMASSSTGNDEENDSLDSGLSTTSSTTSDYFGPIMTCSSSAITPTSSISGKKVHHLQPSTTTTSSSTKKRPTKISGGTVDDHLSSHHTAELKLWACYLPPVIVWNGVKSRLSPCAGGIGDEEGKQTEDKMMAPYMMEHHDMSQGWSQFQVVEALLEPVNPSIFEE